MREEAAMMFLDGYLKGALWVGHKKLFTLFGTFLTRHEIDVALETLSGQGKVSYEKSGRDLMIAYLQ